VALLNTYHYFVLFRFISPNNLHIKEKDTI